MIKSVADVKSVRDWRLTSTPTNSVDNRSVQFNRTVFITYDRGNL